MTHEQYKRYKSILFLMSIAALVGIGLAVVKVMK